MLRTQQELSQNTPDLLIRNSSTGPDLFRSKAHVQIDGQAGPLLAFELLEILQDGVRPLEIENLIDTVCQRPDIGRIGPSVGVVGGDENRQLLIFGMDFLHLALPIRLLDHHIILPPDIGLGDDHRATSDITMTTKPIQVLSSSSPATPR